MSKRKYSYTKILRLAYNGKRISRGEYWMSVFITASVSTIVSYIGDALIKRFASNNFATAMYVAGAIAFFLVLICIGIPLITSRLHDVGKSGAWILITFIPLGWFCLLVLTLMRGDESKNDYGLPPDKDDSVTSHNASVSEKDEFSKLGKQMLDTEVEFAKSFAKMYGPIIGKSKLSKQVMQASMPFGRMVYIYGAILANNELEKEGHASNQNELISTLATIHNEPVDSFRYALSETPKKWRKNSLEAIGNVLHLGDMAVSTYGLYFDAMEIIVSDWSIEKLGRATAKKTKGQRSPNKMTPRKMPTTQFNEINYKDLADKIFDISLDLTNEAGDLMSSATGAARYSMSTIQTATNVGTGLYEYAVILLRKKLKTIFHDKYDFERNDNEMIEAFAKRMMMPATALLKIVDKANEKEWKQHLLELQDSIDIESYLDRVQEVLEKVSL